jgi:periplasmic protein TonB
VVSSKSEHSSTENHSQESAANSLRACLVDGDPVQIARNRSRRRRSLLISVLLQITALAAIILVPILSKTERITLANFVPMPPYRHAVVVDHTIHHTHSYPRTHQFTFCLTCLTCPPVVPQAPLGSNYSARPDTDPGDGIPIGEGTGIECPSCDLRTSTKSQPDVPREPVRKITVTHIDPAMLMHRVEPIFPTLPRQTGQEGTVELHAIIATDGSVRSLQVLEGNALFYQSALDAVRQWRYKPTYLNGNPVEVDTHITVIYRINR